MAVQVPRKVADLIRADAPADEARDALELGDIATHDADEFALAGAAGIPDPLTVATLQGSTASGGNLTLRSTSHATKGTVYLAGDPASPNYCRVATHPGYGGVVQLKAISGSEIELKTDNASTFRVTYADAAGLFMTPISDPITLSLGHNAVPWDGRITSPLGNVQLVPGSASKSIIVRGVASQTANLTDWQDSAGAVLASVNPTGGLTSPVVSGSTASGGGLTLRSTSHATKGTVTVDSNCVVQNDYSAGGAVLRVHRADYLPQGVEILSNLAATADWAIRSTKGTAQAGVLTEANQQILCFGINVDQIGTRDTASAGVIFRFDTRGGGSDGFYVWRLPAGAAGAALTCSFRHTLETGQTVLGSDVHVKTPIGQLDVWSAAASRPGVVVSGYPGQTANLQEWQDSTGAVLGSIDSAGRPAFALAAIRNAADDTAAAALSPPVPIGAIYRTGSQLKIRVT